MTVYTFLWPFVRKPCRLVNLLVRLFWLRIRCPSPLDNHQHRLVKNHNQKNCEHMKKSLENALQQLTHQIRDTEDTHDYSSLRKMVGQIYEEVMLLEFLNSRKNDFAEALSRVESAVLQKSGEEPKCVEEIKPSTTPLNTLSSEDPSNGFLSDEIKVVPIPNGPPKPVSPPSENQNSVDQILDKPPGKTKDQPPQELTKEKDAQSSGVKPKASVNDRANRGPLQLGLNDKIAFVKHLFNGSQEDMQRVLNQLNTMKSLKEVEAFLGAVKSDYNHWEGKEDYEIRLVEMLAARFTD